MSRLVLPSGIVTLLTDFGTDDVYVGVMKGVLLGIAPSARIVDLTHGVPPQDVGLASLFLRASAPYFPDGTVHVAVVDPSVGGGRRAVAVETDRAWFVAPDNGVLTGVLHGAPGYRAVELTDPRFRLPDMSRTFHGRDVFAPAGGQLAVGLPIGELGPACAKLVRLAEQAPRREGRVVKGTVVFADRFGNLITNIAWSDTEEPIVMVRLEGIERGELGSPAASYDAVALGERLSVWNSFGLLEASINGGNLAAELGWVRGQRLDVTVVLREPPANRG